MSEKTKDLGIRIKGNQLILSGSIQSIHHFDAETTKIEIKLSDGTDVFFKHDQKHDIWRVSTNRVKIKDGHFGKCEIEKLDEHGINDKIYFGYHISNAAVQIEGEPLYLVGQPLLSADENKRYEILFKYLQDRGVICLDEMKRDLKLIVSDNYDKSWL